jgi:3-deoxy-D-manno-octulosonic-acid transferase
MLLFYRIFTVLYPMAARILAPFNAKAKLWIEGRKSIYKHLSKGFINNKAPIIWMHCSSLGEFEQGLPVVEKLKQAYPKYKLLVSFFSPSGYHVRKNHPIADWVFYLPMDGPNNAAKFIEIVQPKIAIFVKYEFWYYYLTALEKRAIPTILVSGIFRKDQLFFTWYGSFYRKILSKFNHLFVQDIGSKNLLSTIGFNETISISGDTRFDRVISVASSFILNKAIESFCSNHAIILAGSTWNEDDKALHHFSKAHDALKYIIAPHSIEKDRLNECLQLYPSAMLYSEFLNAYNNQTLTTEPHSLIIDNMGMLSSLYHYATIAFIGGGFTDEGVHNTLEAAVYGVPVVFGPVYEKYIEAIELIETGGAYAAESILDLEKIMNGLLENTDQRISVGKAAKAYTFERGGATQKILHYIQEKRLLTN